VSAIIEVNQLTKRFSRLTAVNNVSFSVNKGEIVGFLGPNGAGKSTTMRILCGYLSADRGTVKVTGHDLMTESLEARNNIGYLPENCPLYKDMRVDEYLNYRARLKGLRGVRLKERVKAVKTQCNVDDVGRRIIGQLSKGYRQRVGLADALVHEPDLLILDEPTQGLDPHQIRQVRDMISQLSKKHTVLLSTHILSEVEMICKKVIIIHEGKIIADESLNDVQNKLCGRPQIIAEIKGAPVKKIVSDIKQLKGVGRVNAAVRYGWVRVSVTEKEENPDLREDLFNLVRSKPEWRMRLLQPHRQSLEEVFMQLTSKEAGAILE